MTAAQAVPAEAPRGASSHGEELMAEFDRQVANLVRKGYPRAARLTSGQFIQQLEPLRSGLADLGSAGPIESGGFPFLLIVKSGLVGRDAAIGRVERRGELGFSVLEPEDLERFRPIPELELPEGVAYLAFDLDTGEETRNVTPEDAQSRIESARRSPLTIDEGIALVTHHPEAVAKNAGFSLAGSRCGDRRVCALWISKGRPKLGWCWAGNPHTWLGTASCGSRAGVPN